MIGQITYTIEVVEGGARGLQSSHRDVVTKTKSVGNQERSQEIDTDSASLSRQIVRSLESIS